MIGTEDTEPGEEPESPSTPPATEVPADHGRSTSLTGPFLYACVAALIWTLVLLCFIIAANASAVSIVAGAILAIVGIFAAIIGIFQPPPFPKINLKITKGVVVTVLVTDFVVSAGWAGWSYYRANREIDVRSTVALSQNIGVRPNHHATLDATITEPRDTIVLEFEVDDNNPHIGSCHPNTVLSMTPNTAGNRGETVSTISGVPTSVDLLAGSSKLHLDIIVTNTRGDDNCSVDLRVVSAKLRNK